MKFEGFIGGAYRMKSLPISAQRCVNWFPEKSRGKGESTNEALRPTPGYDFLAELTEVGMPDGSFIRGIYRTSRGLGLTPESVGSIIVVAGPSVFWYKPSTKTYEKLGSISNEIAKVQMTDDGFNLILADGVSLYKLNLVTKAFGNVGFSLTDPTDAVFLNGYTIVIGKKDGLPQNTVFWSNLYNNTTWEALDYASAEKSADPITALTVVGDSLYLFGPSSYEIMNTTGDVDFPFVKSYASTGTVGLHAPDSVTKLGNSVFFIGVAESGGIAAYMSQGSAMVKISDIPLEEEWSANVSSDCVSYAISYSGHDFVVFNFDALDKTYQYDPSEDEWSELATRDPILDELHRWDPNFVVTYAGNTIVGSRSGTSLYSLSTDYTTENGNTILRIRSTEHLNAEQKPMAISAVRFDMETGSGINDQDPAGRVTQAANLMFRYSYDRSRTYSNEIRQSMGALGKYQHTVEYARLGVCRNFSCEFKISDSCSTAILNGFIYNQVAPRTRR